jgi:hypothetical protein
MTIIENREIPLFSDPRWELQTDLSGRRYTFRISYNTRQDAWTVSILDVNGELLVAGLRLVPGIDMLKKFRASSPGLPPGELVLIDKEGRPQTAEVTRDNLSSRYMLVYTVLGE